MKLEDRVVFVNLFVMDNSNIGLVLYLIFISLNILFGFFIIISVSLGKENLLKQAVPISIALSLLLIIVLIATQQPYAGTLVLGYLSIKIMLVLKK